MSVAAAATTPPVARSSSRRQQSYTSPTAERHQRTPSATTRSPITPGEPQRPESLTHTSSRGPPPSQQAALAGVARRDYETTNLARPPSSRRSSSRDRPHGAPPSTVRTEPGRTHRSSSRGHSRYNSNTPDAASMGGSTLVGPTSASRGQADGGGQGPPMPVKRRTTIGTQTGQWSLGKTLGAGSMGKVKLAKNLETGEQVKIAFHYFIAWGNH